MVDTGRARRSPQLVAGEAKWSMPRILVNYRRDDSAAYAGRLADRLKEHFGRENVFVDIDTIRPGEDFVDRIDQSIAACDVLVAIIGKSWLTAADPKGRLRLDREDDFVRMEIAKALERHIRVIPALVGDAAMPEAAQLPQNLVALSRRQAIEISDSRFHHDVDQLIEALSGTPGLPPPPAQPRHHPLPEPGARVARTPWPLRSILGGAVGLAALALAGWFMLSRDTPSGEGTSAGNTSSGSSSASTPDRYKCPGRRECPGHARGGRNRRERPARRAAASADDCGGACRKDRYPDDLEGNLQRELLSLR